MGGEVQAALEPGETVHAHLELDLDEALRYRPGLLVLAAKRMLLLAAEQDCAASLSTRCQFTT